MKSIKDKAEEYSFIGEGIDLKGVPYKDYNNYKMDGFEAGANYVLECIEEASNICFDEELKHVIEQLKK